MSAAGQIAQSVGSMIFIWDSLKTSVVAAKIAMITPAAAFAAAVPVALGVGVAAVGVGVYNAFTPEGIERQRQGNAGFMAGRGSTDFGSSFDSPGSGYGMNALMDIAGVTPLDLGTSGPDIPQDIASARLQAKYHAQGMAALAVSGVSGGGGGGGGGIPLGPSVPSGPAAPRTPNFLSYPQEGGMTFPFAGYVPDPWNYIRPESVPPAPVFSTPGPPSTTYGSMAEAWGSAPMIGGETPGTNWYDPFASNDFLMGAGAQIAGGIAGGQSAEDIGLGLLPTIGSAFGTLGAAGGSLLAMLLGGMGENRADAVTEPIPVKVMNFGDMTAEFLKVTGINLASLAGQAIDSAVNNLQAREAQVGTAW